LTDPQYLPARVNQHVAIVRVKPEVANARFVLYCINSLHFKSRLLALAQGGATREALTKTTIEDFERPKEFTWGAPCPTMTVDEQLEFILPERSLPGPPKYPDELYDEETESRHPWLRRFAWECDPYVSLPRGDLTSVTEVRVM
jgi:hypothetical protein